MQPLTTSPMTNSLLEPDSQPQKCAHERTLSGWFLRNEIGDPTSHRIAVTPNEVVLLRSFVPVYLLD